MSKDRKQQAPTPMNIWVLLGIVAGIAVLLGLLVAVVTVGLVRGDLDTTGVALALISLLTGGSAGLALKLNKTKGSGS